MTGLSDIINEDACKLAAMDLPWELLTGKTVLISGAYGYVPAYFVHALLARNCLAGERIKVIALCRDEARAGERFAAYRGREDFKLQLQDVRQPLALAETVDFFIHAASPTGFKARYENPADIFTSNVNGCQNLLERARVQPAAGFLFLSSVDVYGLNPTGARMREENYGAMDSLNIHNVYAEAKRAGEMLCRAYYLQYKLPVVIARAGQIIGPGPALHDERLHINFIAQILANNKIILKSDGSARRSFIYITDAVAGMLSALLKGERGQAYNVADENGEASVLELARLAASLAGGGNTAIEFDCEQKDLPEVKLALADVTADSSKLRALGWRPQLSLRQGLERMMAYYGL
jgi:nucleoside-diphosphate-sugar epimerase